MIEIKNKYLKVKINEFGGELSSLIYKNKEYIHQKEELWQGQAPHLFPIVGKLKDNKTIINGALYQMDGHGFIRNSNLKLDYKKENEASFSLKYNDLTLKAYPFKFLYTVKFVLRKKSLITKLFVKNLDNKKIYFNIGEHPGINLFSDIEDYQIIFNKNESFKRPKVTENKLFDFNNYLKEYQNIKRLNLNYQLFENDALLIDKVKSSKVILISSKDKIEFSFKKFKSFAIWTKQNGKYLCLEPWNGYADEVGTKTFFDKKDLIGLEPLKVSMFKTKIKLF